MIIVDKGRIILSQSLRLCQYLRSEVDGIKLKNWLSETWINLAMVNYPYAAVFLEPLPAWPVKVGQKLLNWWRVLALIDTKLACNGYSSCTSLCVCAALQKARLANKRLPWILEEESILSEWLPKPTLRLISTRLLISVAGGVKGDSSSLLVLAGRESASKWGSNVVTIT